MSPIPIYTPPPASSGGSSSSSGNGGGHATGPKSGGGKSGGSKSGGGSKTPKDPMAAYQAQQDRKEREAKAKAAKKYRDQAANLQVQANALNHALNKDFKHSLEQKLQNVNEVLKDQQALLMEGYKERVGSLRGAAKDNEKSQVSQSEINTRNQIRERNSAVSEASAMGAGESDMLQSMMSSLRNWNANQTEVQRGYFDTLRSVNSSLTDLNVDTKTARANNEIQANADKEQLWTNYFNQQSEAYTQLGNTYGQQADYFAMANEMGGGGKGGGGKDKPGKGAGGGKGGHGGGKSPGGPGKAAGKGVTASRLSTWAGDPRPAQQAAAAAAGLGRRPAQQPVTAIKAGPKGPGKPPRHGNGPGPNGPLKPDGVKEARNSAAEAFMNAAQASGKAWDNPGVSDKTMNWDGADPFAVTNNNTSKLQNAMTVRLNKVPEGATLRKW